MSNGIQITLTKIGDFYEATGEDARFVARELVLTLTRSRKDAETPMCGIPYHSLIRYSGLLLASGYSVLVRDGEKTFTVKTGCRHEPGDGCDELCETPRLVPVFKPCSLRDLPGWIR